MIDISDPLSPVLRVTGYWNGPLAGNLAVAGNLSAAVGLLNASRISSDELVCGGFLPHRNDLHTE